jgi:23S rRNA (guanine2445-N2)-methyltransferase / 23S rRNA (guanine2069-N7)-methyltransferase
MALPIVQRPGYFVTAAKGLEEALLEEIRSFLPSDSQSKVNLGRGGVLLQGELEDAYRVCLYSRIANRVLLPIARFEAPTPEKLYGGAKAIRWRDHVTPDRTIAVDFSSSHSQITHTQYGALKVKDAICDQLRSVLGERPSVDVSDPDVRINVYVHQDFAQVAIDLSGRSLHQRGYRVDTMEAPIKENLAAALLWFADWRKVAEKGGAFLDPLCGSGTLAIEAAEIALDRAPGLRRKKFGFSRWLGHDSALWDRLVEEAKVRAQEGEARAKKNLAPIWATDRDSRAVAHTISNVEQAGLRSFIHVEKRDALEATPPPGASSGGIIVTNPPYGERLGEVDHLKGLYEGLGDAFKKQFAGWTAYVLTSEPALAKSVGLQPGRKFVVYNGALECRLLKYELFAGSHRRVKPQV